MHDLVEADLWSQLPADLEALLARLPRADLYLQDEMQVAFHPTLTRLWCRKGRRGQRLVEAPGDNSRVYGFGLVDWREGWFDGRVAPGRTAEVFCEQVRAAVARSKQRARVAIVMTDNLKTHTSVGSLLVRTMLTELKGQLYLVYTPAYDPDANRIEWLWRVSRRVVTHNHSRGTFELLLEDLTQHCRGARSDSCRGPSPYRESFCSGQGSRCSFVSRSSRIIILEAFRSIAPR